MTATIDSPAKTSPPGTAFLAFNSKVPLVAAKAAVEIERYRNDKAADLSSALELSRIVTEKIGPSASQSPSPKRLHDPLGTGVLTRAYNSSNQAEPGQNLQNSLRATLDVAAQLSSISPSLTDAQLLRLRDFCISLAEMCQMNSKLVSEDRPTNSHKKTR